MTHTKPFEVFAQRIKFSVKNFFSKCEEIRSFLRIFSHLLKRSPTGNLLFWAVNEKQIKFLLIAIAQDLRPKRIS